MDNKDVFAKNLKYYMSINNKTRNDICEALGFSYYTFSDWINGKKYPRMDKVEKLANYFNILKSDLIEDKNNDTNKNIKIPKEHNIPLYSYVSCGTGLFVDEHIEDYIAIPDRYIKKGHEYFANIAKGVSMIRKGIKDGDVLIFEKTNIIENGEIGAFCVGESEAVCKIFRKLPSGMILLESANEDYEPIEIDITDECFRVIGKLVCSLKKF